VRIKIRAATNSEVAVLVRESLSDNVASISDWRAILGRLRLSASDSAKSHPRGCSLQRGRRSPWFLKGKWVRSGYYLGAARLIKVLAE